MLFKDMVFIGIDPPSGETSLTYAALDQELNLTILLPSLLFSQIEAEKVTLRILQNFAKIPFLNMKKPCQHQKSEHNYIQHVQILFLEITFLFLL